MLIQRSMCFFLTCHHLYTLISVLSGPISLNRIVHYHTSAYPILSFSFFHHPTYPAPSSSYSRPCSVHDSPLATPSRCVLPRDLWTCSSVYRVCSTQLNDPLGNILYSEVSPTHCGVSFTASFNVFVAIVHSLIYNTFYCCLWINLPY